MSVNDQFLAFLLTQRVRPSGTETPAQAAHIGKIDKEAFEAQQALREVEDEQERQYEAWLVQREAE